MLIPLGMADWCVPFWVILTLTSGLISRLSCLEYRSPVLQLTFLKCVLCYTNSFGGGGHSSRDCYISCYLWKSVQKIKNSS